MVATLMAALSIAAAAAIDVPYLSQTDALCGGAAAAMVFRYWGDAHAGVAQFEPLVDRRAGGIADAVLVRAVESRGWRVEPSGSTIEDLERLVRAGQPPVVLISERRSRYHYVVVVGITKNAIVVHDPSWGPSRAIAREEFGRRWSAARSWGIVILPTQDRHVVHAETRDATTPAKRPAAVADPCDEFLTRTIEQIRTEGFDRADALLAQVRAECPSSPGPLRELAAVRFAQHRWTDAAAYARSALTLDPNDAYAIDLLGSSLFMTDDVSGALRAWNRIGKPRLDTIQISGLRYARYETVAQSLGLQPNAVLTADAFARASRRVEELPGDAAARVDIRPAADGFASVGVALVEPRGVPHGSAEWAGAGVRAAVDREVAVTMPGFSGDGDTWSASWRWWNDRPRVAMAFAAPHPGGIFGVWRVDASWERESYGGAALAAQRETRTHGGLTVSDWLTGSTRYALSTGIDAWDHAVTAPSIGAAIERRWLRDRVSAATDWTTWLPAERSSFTSLGARVTVRSTPAVSDARPWTVTTTLGAQRVSDAAPLTLWPGAGDGRARSPLLRAHPLLDDGSIDVGRKTAFGRTVAYSNSEATRWVGGSSLMRVGIAAFVDAAHAQRRFDGNAVTQVDAGAGLRFRLPGSVRVLRVDVAHGLRDGGTALTVGWVY